MMRPSGFFEQRCGKDFLKFSLAKPNNSLPANFYNISGIQCNRGLYPTNEKIVEEITNFKEKTWTKIFVCSFGFKHGVLF